MYDGQGEYPQRTGGNHTNICGEGVQSDRNALLAHHVQTVLLSLPRDNALPQNFRARYNDGDCER